MRAHIASEQGAITSHALQTESAEARAKDESITPEWGANADFTDVFTGAPVRFNVMILNRVTTNQSADGGKT